MSKTQPEAEPIIRIAALGDGVTASGRHVSGTAPGDLVDAAGQITRGPLHQNPPCAHFTACGGCDLQHVKDVGLRDFVTQRVVNAAEGQGIEIGDLLETHLSPPHSRRRVSLHGAVRIDRKKKGSKRAKSGSAGAKSAEIAALGYRAKKSHQIVDLSHCDVMTHELWALVGPLKNLLGQCGEGSAIGAVLTETDQGVACALKGVSSEGLERTEALLDFARDHALARLSIDDGYGPEIMWEPEPVSVTLGGTSVSLPDGAFLQPTRDGEACLVRDAKAYLGGAMRVADLFAGLGTFAFALAGPAKALAVEASLASHMACKQAAARSGGSVHALHRDLFRAPLQADEVERFDGVLLDPPRAGARDQCAQIARSSAARLAYISCNPSSWARDAKMLIDGGFRLKKLRPVGQFRWSTHVELTSYFER